MPVFHFWPNTCRLLTILSSVAAILICYITTGGKNGNSLFCWSTGCIIVEKNIHSKSTWTWHRITHWHIILMGVRQNLLMICRECWTDVIHVLCASTSVHNYCMSKNVRVSSTCECIPSEERQTDLFITRCTFVISLLALFISWQKFEDAQRRTGVLYVH